MLKRELGTMTGGLCAAGLMIVSGAGVAYGATIAEVAPENAVLVAGTDDFAALRAAADRAGLMDLWNEPQVQQFVDEQSEEMLAEMRDDLDDLGFTLDDLSAPSGPAGFALFVDMSAEDARDSEYHFLAMSDFGENADKMAELMRATIEQGEEEGRLAFDEEDYRGVTITTIETLDDDAEMEEDGEMDWGDDWDEGEELWTTSYYARSGDVMMVTTSLRALESSIEKMDGDAGDPTVTGRTGWSRTVNMLGDRPQVYLVSVTEPWYELTQGIQEMQQAEMGAEAPPVMDLLAASGLTSVQGFGVGMNLDADGAVVETKFAVATPELDGVLGLIPAEGKPFTAPNFVSADAAGLSMGQFEFGGLLGVIREAMMELPEQVRQQGMMQIGMAEGMVGPLLNNIGPEVYLVQQITRPYSANSQQQLVAMTAQSEDGIRTFIQQMQGMFPLESREFAGGTIWTMPQNMGGGMGGMGMPGLENIGIGLGAGHLFIGQTGGIETALRTASDANAPRLADDERFQAGLREIEGSGLSFSWSDMEESMEYTQWMLDNFEEIQREQLRQMGMTEEEIDQQMEWMGDTGPGMGMLPDNLPDLTILNKYIGDSVGWFEVTDGGIVGTFKTLRPE